MKLTSALIVALSAVLSHTTNAVPIILNHETVVDVTHMEKAGDGQARILGDMEVPFGPFSILLEGANILLEELGDGFGMVNGTVSLFSITEPFLERLLGGATGLIDIGIRHGKEITFMQPHISDENTESFFTFGFDMESISWLEALYNAPGIGNLIPRLSKFQMAVDPKTPMLFMEASAMFPSIPLPLVLQGIPIPIEVNFALSGATLGLSMHDHLKLESPAAGYSPHDLMPDEMVGNGYVAGGMTIGVSMVGQALDFFSLGMEFNGRSLVNMNLDTLASQFQRFEFSPLSSMESIAINGGITLFARAGPNIPGLDMLPEFSLRCSVDDTTALWKNESPDMTLVVTGSFRLGETCEFGSLNKLFSTPEGTRMVVYGHITSRDDIPRTSLRALGEVEMNIPVLQGTRMSTEVIVEADGGLAVKTDLDMTMFGVSMVPLNGIVHADGGKLRGTVNLDPVRTPWDSELQFSVTAEVAGFPNNPNLVFLGSLTYFSAIFDSTKEFHVIGRLEKDGDRLALLMCLKEDEIDADDELASISKAGAGGDNCIDWETVINGIPNDGPCINHSMCASERCQHFDDLRPLGACRERLPQGEGCDEDVDCQSGRCKLDLLTLKGTCMGTLPNGANCFEDSDCQTGRCAGFILGLGECRALEPLGSFCSEDSDCESQDCQVSWKNIFIPKCRGGDE